MHLPTPSIQIIACIVDSSNISMQNPPTKPCFIKHYSQFSWRVKIMKINTYLQFLKTKDTKNGKNTMGRTYLSS
jgi:hypothetical protein